MKSNRRVIIAIAVLLPLLAAGGYGVYYVMNQGSPVQWNNSTAQNASSAIPDLGSRSYTPPPANDTPEGNGEAPVDDAGEDGGETGPEEEVANSEREIDIWLSNLALSTKAGDRKGIALYHEMLKKARPHELVDDRVRNALTNEQSAWVRIQFYHAFHAHEAALDWATHVHDTRTAKFLGTDDLYVAGEIEELKQISRTLYGELVNGWKKNEQGDARLMALLRNVLDTEKPAWLLEETTRWVVLPMLEAHLVSFVRSIEQELRNLLLRRKAERGIREHFFAAFILTFDPHKTILNELERSEWWDYASFLPLLYPGRHRLTDVDPDAAVIRLSGPMQLDWVEALTEGPEAPALIERLLLGSMPIEDKRLLIQRIAEYAVPNGRAMIEAGLDRKDENFPDYLVAFGSFAADDADLQRLTRIADDPDVAAAQGAIEGLRRSGLNDADAELRKVLEQGTNIGVKSQALGALLARAKNKDNLLEEYLDAGKDASLRAVAVAHVDITDIERLKTIVTDDASPRVRQAALTRLGGIVPENSRVRKDLLGFFRMVSSRDSSPVIRKAADKYAAEFQD
ncbi:MAG: hypothetical protein K8I27_16445 [Planctomycetes bacterium]|nr:hypothetical protein [Planctomycetota bacterium]